MKHEPFMRMCTHGFHAVFHGEMAVGGADAIAGCLSQVSDDLILHVHKISPILAILPDD